MTVVGSHRMVQYDDTASDEAVRVFDRGMEFTTPETFGEYQLTYRSGDMIVPRLEAAEPLSLELADFAHAIRTGAKPRSNAQLGPRDRRRDGGRRGVAAPQRRADRHRWPPGAGGCLMEFVVLIRNLWRHRVLVAFGALLALAVGVMMAFHFSPPTKLESRAYHVGIASTTALLDTPSSQVVDLGDQSDAATNAAGSLPGRAALIASVLTTSPLKDEIAKSAGIDPSTLIAGAPAPGSTMPVAPIGSISIKDRRASLLTVSTYQGLPILAVDVTAPDEQTAARLSNGAIKVLQAHLDTLANSDGVPVNRRLVVKQLGDARQATSERGPSRKIAAIAAIFVFGLVCAAIIGFGWFAQRWRQAEGMELFPPIDWQRAPVNEPDLEPAAPEDDVRRPPPAPPSGGRWDVVR